MGVWENGKKQRFCLLPDKDLSISLFAYIVAMLLRFRAISIPGRDPWNTLPEKLVDKYLSQVSFYFVLDYARIMLEDDNTSRRVFNH